MGLHWGNTKIAEDPLVTTIRAMIRYMALFHARLVVKIRSSKRQIEILVNMVDKVTTGIMMISISNAKNICFGDKS